ncbi:MAG: hypothetical protein QM621_09685 [Aeromicrobium sp.]|uniref:hypothetical protein n=1 Tax=Aeromicrobium sp. TaxID=1871063 RepID=UPI0039E4A124
MTEMFPLQSAVAVHAVPEAGGCDLLEKYWRDLRGSSGELLPPQTVRFFDSAPAAYALSWYDRAGRSEEAVVSFHDPSGSDFASSVRVDQVAGDYLSGATELLLVLDGATVKTHRECEGDILGPSIGQTKEMVESLVALLRVRNGLKKNQPIDTPLAVVVTKTDLFEESLSNAYPPSEEILRLLNENHCGEIVTTIEKNFSQTCFFGASVLGSTFGSNVGGVLRWFLDVRGLSPV